MTGVVDECNSRHGKSEDLCVSSDYGSIFAGVPGNPSCQQRPGRVVRGNQYMKRRPKADNRTWRGPPGPLQIFSSSLGPGSPGQPAGVPLDLRARQQPNQAREDQRSDHAAGGVAALKEARSCSSTLDGGVRCTPKRSCRRRRGGAEASKVLLERA